MNNKPVFYMLIGLPYAGKSTFAKKQSNFSIIEQTKNKTDLHRNLLKSLGNKENIILDRMNLTSKHRSDILKQAKNFGYEIKAYFFNTSKETLLKRYNKSNSDFNKMYQFISILDIEKPELSEGFDEINELYWHEDINCYEYSTISRDNFRETPTDSSN